MEVWGVRSVSFIPMQSFQGGGRGGFYSASHVYFIHRSVFKTEEKGQHGLNTNHLRIYFKGVN